MVYLIDDEPVLLELLSEVVKIVGMNAQGYSRASCFFEQVKFFETDSILVLDLHMPEMDGIEVMRRLAKMTNPPALILISGHDIGVLLAAEKLGRAQGLDILTSISKPVSLDKFRQLLEQHVPDNTWNQQDNIREIECELTVTELRKAINDDQLIIHYQPQIEIAAGSLTGVEALVRWQHPKQELLIYPDRFIHIAERNGLMGEFTYYVIRKVIHQLQLWQDVELSTAVSVNVSGDNITSLIMPELISEILSDNQMDHNKLTVEVTESALMGELATSLDILTRLRLKGIKLSIDDFGTGYSSLSQLHRIPFTELKVDSSFVSKMVKDSEARAIVKTCILLGHELNMRVVAEGIENRQTWDILADLGCDVAQGYFIAKPMPGSDLVEWVTNRRHSK